MDPAKWCLQGLEESVQSIEAAQKLYEKNPSDPRFFVEIKKNIVDVFRGLTKRVSEKFDLQNKKLKQISEAFTNRIASTPEELSAVNQFLKNENQELKNSLQAAKKQIDGYEADLKKLEDKNKHLAADSAHSKCEQCKQRPRDVLFIPCRHFFVCEDCSNGMRNCPYCDGVIKESIVAEY